MFFLVFKLYNLILFITTYVGHGKCFIWWFLVLAFIETARLNTTSSSNFSWSGNDTSLVNYVCQICKLKLLFCTCLKFWTIFILTCSYLQLLLNIFYHRSTAIVLGTVLFDTFWRSWKLLVFEENIFEVFLNLCFFLSKNQHSRIRNSGMIGCKNCQSLQWITFLMFYRLVYKIPSHLNDLILAWSIYNHVHNILRLFHDWAHFPFTTSEMNRNYY